MAATGESPAVVFSVYGALGYAIIAAACSSPQTAEINASSRASTLMKWVHLGLLQLAFFVAIGVWIEMHEERPVWPPILGAGLASGLMYVSYSHAMKAGGASTEPGTEGQLGSRGRW